MKLFRTTILNLFPLHLLIFIVWIVSNPLNAQILVSDPLVPTDNVAVTITFDASGTALEGYDGVVYAHTGVNIEGVGNWQHVIGSWGANAVQPSLTRITTDLYSLEITPDIRTFYSVPSQHKIIGLAFVFRNAEGTQQTADLFLDVYEAGLSVAIINPAKGQPIIEKGSQIEILAAALQSQEIKLYINDQQVASSTDDQVSYTFDSNTYDFGTWWIIATATDGSTQVADTSYLFVRPQPNIASLPENVLPGINYTSTSTATLVLHDPPASKEFVFVIGDFNNWMIHEDYYMNVTPDGTHFWLHVTDLTPGSEYAYQYFIDNEIRIADPYTEKVLDPNTDNQIKNEGRYPGLIAYPTGKTHNPASVLHPGRIPYQWQVTEFIAPAVEDLVIYELLIRDFLEPDNNTYKGVREKLQYLKDLGINAIELLPITNFEGNLSWGYNPSFFFAPDKYYGPREELKKLIDEAHSMGIAVILDMVWNHSFSQSPLLQMYFDSNTNSPAIDNPWYSDPIFVNPAMNFGYKFDHGSPYFRNFMDRANAYWLNEFKIDGFRFDLTKGFTTRRKGTNDEWGSMYDQERIDNLIRMHNHIKSINPDAYVILEHLADNSEETVLANAGMLLWGNMNYNYNEATMGWNEGSKSDLNWGSYQARGWNNPHLITYMESHDEERLMVKNLQWGNSSNDYDITDLTTALRRIELAATFFFTIPGPKMIWQFGELGYDVSIDYNGRTGMKPVKWNYLEDPARKRLHDIYSALIELKKKHEVFRTTDYTLATTGAGKRIHLNHTNNMVTIVGNFGVTNIDLVPQFQQTGTWYEFFSRKSIQVNNTNEAITLKPGEYKLYSTVEFPDHGLSLTEPVDIGIELNVFPNPSDQGFTFTFLSNEEYHFRIINMQGQIVYQQMHVFDSINHSYYWDGRSYNGTYLSSGMYFFNIYSSARSIDGKLIVK